MKELTSLRDAADPVEALSHIMARPNLVGLAYASPHPELWPKGFVWDYSNCDHCAMGLAFALWKCLEKPAHSKDADQRQLRYESYFAREMACSYRAARKIFFQAGELKKVTPDDVADVIDGYLKTV